MLQIRLHKVPSSDGGGGAKALSLDAVTVACPDHLVLADLPVAKSIGSVTAASLVKTVGRRSRRQLGERVHICVSCDVPIAIYGRLSPCEHVFCLDCARSDSICYLCDERIQKIQTIKMMEGIFICAAPHCLKSFLKKTEFETHIQQAHNELLQLNLEREGNDSEPVSAKKPSASDSTVQAPPKPVFSPNSNSQAYDHEDKSHHRSQPPPPPLRPIMQPNLMPPFFGQMQNHPLEMPPVGFDRNAPQNQPPNFVMPVNSNPMMVPPLPFGYPPFQPEGSQPFFVTSPYEIPRPNLISSSEVGSEQGSLLGFPSGNMNFQEQPYPRPWLMGPAGAAFEGSPTVGQGTIEGSFPQMGDYGGNIQGGALVDGKGILAAQPFPQPPPPPMPHPQLAQVKRGGGEEQGFGWQRESSSFGRGQD